jgi:hypothetical protein
VLNVRIYRGGPGIGVSQNRARERECLAR